MIKRSFAVFGLIVVALITSMAIPSLATTEAAGSQRSIWNETGLEQTSSTYWTPVLNQPDDYTAPDLAGGRAFMRLDVVSKPSDMYVVPMVCFWRHGATQFQEETCAAGRHHPFTSEGTYYLDLGVPADWWQKNRSFDWSKPVSVGRIMIRDGVQGGRLLLNERCGGACYLGDDLDEHVPIKMSSQLIFVAKDQQLNPPSSWRGGCPESWASACRGDEATPVTTTPAPPTTPPVTTPGTTTPPTTPTTTVAPTTTVPTPAFVDVEPGIRRLTVTYSIPRASQYQVRYKPDGGSTQWTSPTTSTSQTLRDLTANTRHTVFVRGYVNGSWRDWISTTATPQGDGGSNPTDTVAPSTTVASDAAFIQAVAGPSSLTVSYGIPKATLFQVRYRPAGRSTQWTDPTSATTQTFRDLAAGTLHTIEVRGLIKGTWREWISTTATPLAAGPSTNGGVEIELTAKANRLRVSWTSDGAATSYQVRTKPADKTTWKTRAPQSTQLANLNGLVGGTMYDVEVRAQIDGSWQPWVRAQATPTS